jgi:hypothetical protein
MTAPNTTKELLEMIARMPEKEQEQFWTVARKTLSRQLATSIDKRPRLKARGLSMQEIVEEVRIVRKQHGKTASTKRSTGR